MTKRNFYDQLYQEFAEIADFPREKANALFAALPPYSRDMAAAIDGIPTEEGEDHSATKAWMALTLSVFIQDDLERNRSFSPGEAVLYGDYLFALTFSLLPKEFTAEETQKLTDRLIGFNENRQRRIGKAKEISNAKEDYGNFLAEIAKTAAEKAGWSEPRLTSYAKAAENLGILWGCRCEDINIPGETAAALCEEIEAALALLPPKAAEDFMEIYTPYRKLRSNN